MFIRTVFQFLDVSLGPGPGEPGQRQHRLAYHKVFFFYIIITSKNIFPFAPLLVPPPFPPLN